MIYLMDLIELEKMRMIRREMNHLKLECHLGKDRENLGGELKRRFESQVGFEKEERGDLEEHKVNLDDLMDLNLLEEVSAKVEVDAILQERRLKGWVQF